MTAPEPTRAGTPGHRHLHAVEDAVTEDVPIPDPPPMPPVHLPTDRREVPDLVPLALWGFPVIATGCACLTPALGVMAVILCAVLLVSLGVLAVWTVR